ncbi:lipopolysaccharide biosynthesis protein [Polynucleobacter sp. JS-JIR-II-b4]|uniref:lipopolysaccharide biosynthesis protein n=1 Tax=Polynucleobacter sp. JS-JIR-II-b4 TaxID=1758390 RepID=UPI001BFCFB9E|nr:oligosaccharide flippase family protein [Polynucleobacter sp. JS-JIR-II-b4]QWE02825.1 oligosaccharide flippase family protein [Polynucleobacter sp. JS-JIR-II-b4]
MKLETFFDPIQYKALFQSQLARNIFTNYLAVIWMGGLSILLIPFYLKFLGSEQWGIVAICMALQGFFNLLDAGLAQIMPRDVARVSHDPDACLKTYVIYQRTYLFLALSGFLIGQFSVPWLVDHWFSGGNSFSAQDSWAFHLVIVQFLFQFSNNANIGYWNGKQLQAMANFRQCAFGSLKHFGALSLVYFWQADAIAYLIPFTVVSAFEFFTNRHAISQSLKGSHAQPIDWMDYKKLGSEGGMLFVGVLIGMLASQMDRIVLSKYVDVASFGIYVIVANLGLAVMQLQHPLVRAFLPRMTQDLAGNNKSSFRRLAFGMTFLCIVPCLVLALLSPWILKVWIGNPEVVSEGSLVLSLLFCAVACNAIYQLIYQRVLVSGDGRWVIKTNAVILILILPLILSIVSIFGITAGGIYWLAMTFLQLIFGLLWLNMQSRATKD